MKQGGTVASVGLAADMKLNTTVMPFILRGVNLLGIDSSECPMPLRQKIWDRLANEWRPSRVQTRVVTIDFDELPTHFDAFLKGMVRGRTVVRVGADTRRTLNADSRRCTAYRRRAPAARSPIATRSGASARR